MKTKAEMVDQFQCVGCAMGDGTAGCHKFHLKDMDAGGFACENHVPGTFSPQGPPGSEGLTILLGLPEPMATLANTARSNHVIVLIGKENGKRYVASGDAMNVPVWKMQHEGCTLVRIARPLSGRFTTLIVDGEIDVPAPAVDPSALA
jgi:hypothetical protein